MFRFWIATNTYLQEKPKPKIFAPDSIPCGKCGSIRVIMFDFDSDKQTKMKGGETRKGDTRLPMERYG
jgi:hypothetical protein